MGQLPWFVLGRPHRADALELAEKPQKQSPYQNKMRSLPLVWKAVGASARFRVACSDCQNGRKNHPPDPYHGCGGGGGPLYLHGLGLIESVAFPNRSFHDDFMRFTLIDRIVDFQPGVRITAVKSLTMAEEYLADHFPNFPVMPGVLMLEAMTQASAWLIRAERGFRPQHGDA